VVRLGGLQVDPVVPSGAALVFSEQGREEGRGTLELSSG
jgi:hypothetical protein